MECPQIEWLTGADYVAAFNEKLAAQRIPFSGSLDLTARCNLRCRHCYVASHAVPPPAGRSETPTARLLSILDEAAGMGCLYLLLTGGEPLLRKDFADVYRRAKKLGMLVTVFTNATLVTEAVLDVFADLPPHHIEISVYGATEATYEKVTGVAGSYGRCMDGIRRLLDRKLNVRLKTILMTLNRHEFHEIARMAAETGVKFRFDAAIFPRFNGDAAPVQLRVPPEEAVDMEMADPERLESWRKYYHKAQARGPSDVLYQCGAARTNFHVDAYGRLRPCVMIPEPWYNLCSGSFAEGWHKAMPRLWERRAGPGFPCGGCRAQALCGFCPAFFALETGAEDVPSEYLCAMGRRRMEAVAGTCQASERVGGGP